MDIELEKVLCGKLVNAVQEDKEFATRMLDAENAEALTQLAGEKGIELGQEEASKLFSELSSAKSSGELTDDDLKNVSGGFAITLSAFAIWCIIAAGTAATTYGVYKGAKEEAAKTAKKRGRGR